MNWEAVGAIGQILGVVVVVLSLIYVAAQVRQGNRFAKLQARQRMIEQAHDELYGQMADPSITYANVKPGPLTEEEQAKLSLFLIAFMRQREWEWFEYRDGIIDKDVYTAYHDVIPIHPAPRVPANGGRSLGRFAFNPEFVAAVDELLASSQPSTYLRDMRTWDNA